MEVDVFMKDVSIKNYDQFRLKSQSNLIHCTKKLSLIYE